MMNGKTITCISVHNKWVLFPNTNNITLYYFIKVQFTIFVYNLFYTSEDIPTPHPKKNPPTPRKVHTSILLTV